MMMKIVKLLIAICIVYVTPLVSSPHAMLSPPLLLAAAGAALLFLVQPNISKREIREHQMTDRHSATTILLAGVLVHMLPVIEWQTRGFPWPSPPQVVGLALLAAGLGLRFYAIRVLGRYFTATVQVQFGQALITRGPYARIRHPSYLGALVAIAGHAVLLGAPISAAAAVALMFFVYRRRILLEEAALRDGLGPIYRDYESRTDRLVPRLW